MKVLKHLVPIPTLRWVSLPVEGLGEDFVNRARDFKCSPGGAFFRYKLEKCGRDFWELRAAAEHYRAQRRPNDRLAQASLCRQGVVLHIAVKALIKMQMSEKAHFVTFYFYFRSRERRSIIPTTRTAFDAIRYVIQ